jgi:sarcosine oxidase subunit beta
MERFDAIVIGGGVIAVDRMSSRAPRCGSRAPARARRAWRGNDGTVVVHRAHALLGAAKCRARAAALDVFADFPRYLDDEDADCGLNRCGLMLIAPEGERAAALRATLAFSAHPASRPRRSAPTPRDASIRCSTSVTIR